MIKVFDSHCHTLQHVSVAESIESFKTYAKHNNVCGMNFLSIAKDLDNIENDYMQNVKNLFLKRYFGAPYMAFAGLEHHVDLTEEEQAEEYLKQVKLYREVGFDGLKMLEGKPNMRRIFKYKLSDPVYDKMFAYMEKTGFPLTLHNADPKEFWHKELCSEYAIKRGWYVTPDQLKKEEMDDDVLKVMEKHPGLHLTLAHFGFFSQDINVAEKFLSYKHTMFDTTPAGEQYFHMLEDWDNWKAFFVKYQDRIKYGSDTYNYKLTDYENLRSVLARPNLVREFFSTDTVNHYYSDEYTGVKLDDAIVEKIFYKNAMKEYGEPAKVNDEYIKARIAELKPFYQYSEFNLNDMAFIEDYLK